MVKKKNNSKKQNKVHEFFKKLITTVFKDKSLRTEHYQTYGYGLLIAVVLTTLLSLLLPRGRSYQFGGLNEGEIYVGETIIAPFTCAINKTDEEYQRDIQKAKEKIMPVFVKEDSVCERKLTQLTLFFDGIDEIIATEKNKDELFDDIATYLKKYKLNPDEKILNFFAGLDYKTRTRITADGNGKSMQFREIIEAAYIESCDRGILDRQKQTIHSIDGKISVFVGNEETEESVNYYYDLEDVKTIALDKLRSVFRNDEDKAITGYRIFSTFIAPNLLYDNEETDLRIIAAIAIVPRAKGTILENEKIIETYDKVTREHITKLNSLAIEKAERESARSFFLAIIRYLGKFLMVAIGLSILIVFLILNRWRLLRSVRKTVLNAVIIILVCLAAFIIDRFTHSPYLFPITIASMLLTIFFDTRVGFVGTIAISLIFGIMRGNDFLVAYVSIFAGTAAVISVAKVRSRTWFIRSILMISTAYILSITAIEILRYTSFTKFLVYWLHGIANGFLSPLLTYGLQVLFEFLFNMTTDLRLLDLSDLNRPLLRRMAVEAPGTYHHSIMVGNLAEVAAEAIGADGLLARVGSYYHDIGKIEKPEYYIENIQRSKNPHEKLSPNMSSLILATHVKRGLEIADLYKLPQEIKNFIPEHHGTTVMAFFYKKAQEQTKEDIDTAPFRYPGPKPKSKETGIVMLADGVEAASRSLKDPSASRIKGMVTSIVHERFRDSELDECSITLRDLTKIIDSFTTVLLGTFHGRIEYPNQEELFFPKNSTKEKNNEIKD